MGEQERRLLLEKRRLFLGSLDGWRKIRYEVFTEDPGVGLDFNKILCGITKVLKLYEGPFDDVPESERKYLNGFNGEETRYIYAELVLNNKCKQSNWQCEVFIKFHNEARELKGQLVRLVPVKKDDTTIQITAGWGPT